tara:strand:+ start:1389 stop:2633 length:1245 start_codon:yes stop_codon:yes gene_type:complete
MSGSIAAIAAYDGTGTQGYGTTDKSLPGVKSIFWNENDTDKYYVNGCSFSEVSSNKGVITSPETVVFTFDNDADAINDLTLVIERIGELTTGTKTSYYHMLYFVERIEVCIGNQVICTINTAQLVKEFFDAGDYSLFSDYVPTFSNTGSTGVSAQRINLNIFRMLSKNGADSSYLMCCANNQSLQVKVYPQNFTKSDFNSYMGDASGTANFALSALPRSGFTFSLYANKYSMTNAERDFLRNQVVPKRTNITQYAELSSLAKPSGTTLNANSQITINCDHFNLYTSNLYILGMCHNQLSNLGGFDVELYLNSTSYSGTLPYSISFNQPNVWAISEGSSNRFFYYKIPIAKNAHMEETDQAYVPFSKFDSIRVILTAKKDITIADYSDFFNTLTVIAEGKCTALYQDGAVVFNNY